MRIAFVTQWFPPERGTLVSAAIADGLAGRGHEVDVLTGFPNYPTGRLHPDFPLRPYRRDHPGPGVVVHRAPLYPSHDADAVRRTANYASFAISSAWTARRRLSRPDVWLTYSSPATAALAAMTAPRRLRAPSCLIIQDLWPDSVTDSGFVGGRLGRIVEAGLTRFCGWTYRRSDAIGVISPGMRRILVGRGVAPEKIYDTPNWIDDAHLRPGPGPDAAGRAALGLPPGRLFMFAGNLGQLQGLEPLVDAFATCPQAQLALVGDGVAREALHRRCAESGLANVHFVPPQDIDRIGDYIAASDVQIVSLKDTPLLRVTMPSKVQASLAAGRPVLAHAPGDVADLVARAGAGLTAPPGDLAGTAAAIRQFCAADDERLRQWGQAARRCYEREFAPAAGAARLEDMLIAAIDRGRPRLRRPDRHPTGAPA